MSSVLLHGRASWDRNLFPPDEFEERVAQVQAAMAREDLGGLLVAGNFLEYGNLAYLTGYLPWAGWSAAVVPAEGDITLVTGVGGGRELPVARTRTWVPDVRNLKNLNDALRDLLADRGISGRVGLASLGTLGSRLEQRIRAGLEGFACVDAGPLLARQRAALRSRELSAVREAASIAQRAAEALGLAHQKKRPNTAAAIDADYVARRDGALDVRILVNQDASGELQPVEDQSDFRSDTMVAYIAVNAMGYWADLGVTLGTGPLLDRARAAVEVMVRAARAGARASDVAAAASVPEAKRWGLGAALGLGLNLPPAIAADDHTDLVSDMVLSLRVRLPEAGGPGALATELVRVTPTGGVALA
ncbi:MAG TPA: aminopeptidase P family N-terminal domain-containing protein [Chloroflexota bacterium]|nr:aminopeptidase P family N-terminal domain-containing protein [Chloroflexota bacterium]